MIALHRVRSGAAVLRLLYSVVLAAICALVLSDHVYWTFQRIRFREVTKPHVASPSLSIPLPDLSRLGEEPAAFIFRVRNPTNTAVTITACLNDGEDRRVLTAFTVSAGKEVRVDTAAHPPARAGARVVLTGDASNWELTYLEIANLHGFTTAPFPAVIVPRAPRADVSVAWWILVLGFAALVSLQPRIGWPALRPARIAYSIASGVVLFLLLAVRLSGTVSPYRVLLSPGAFLLCVAVLYAGPIVRARSVVWRFLTTPASLRVLRAVGIRLPHLAMTTLFLVAIAQTYDARTGFTRFIWFGKLFEDRAVPVLRETPHAVDPLWGYDGQFYAQLAFDPLLRNRETVNALDVPSYRARRIVMPAVAHVMGFGRPWLTLQIFALVNVVSWLVLAYLLLYWLPIGGIRATLAWIACMFSDGLMYSVTFALPDGPSMLLIAAAILAVERKRSARSAALLGIAGITRETSLFSIVLLRRDETYGGRTLARAIVLVALAFGPLILWTLYLWKMGLVPASGASNFAAPFSAYLSKWTATISELRGGGWHSFAPLSLLALVALTTQGVVLVSRPQSTNAWWRVGVIYAALMMLLGSAVWDGHPGAAVRVVLPMTIAFNVLLLEHRWFWPLWVLGNISVLSGLWRIGVLRV